MAWEDRHRGSGGGGGRRRSRSDSRHRGRRRDHSRDRRDGGAQERRSWPNERQGHRGGGQRWRDDSRRNRGGGGRGGRRDSRDGYRGGRNKEWQDRSRSRRWSPRGGSRRKDRRRASDSRGGSSPKASARKAPPREPPKQAKPKPPPPPASASGSSKGSGSGSGSDSNDDEIIHFDWQKGMVLNSRYHLTKLMGDGTFGRVVLAKDMQAGGQEVAIKVIRDVPRYMENAKIEADILKDIRKADPKGTTGNCVMYETFIHEQKFFCLVFEPLGVSLYDFLKANGFRGYYMEDVQAFARQSMQALSFLHGQLRMTHTDLKPENILLESMEPARAAVFPRESEWLRRKGSSLAGLGEYMRPVSNRIKLIDFGNATYEEEHHSSIINTRQYRGPEVLLSLGWNELSDQWSIGCILAELYSGEQLFETHEELEHLALMNRIVGPLPQAMLARTSPSVRDRYFTQDRNGQFRLLGLSSSTSERHVHSQRPLAEQFPQQHAKFADFLATLCTVEPSRRPSAVSTLQHEFFASHFQD